MSKKILQPDEWLRQKDNNHKNDLWFFGDSITKGVGCLDPNDGNQEWECEFYIKYPSVISQRWTTILASHFQMNEKNYGLSGASPDYVLSTFTHFMNKFKKGDLIILQIPFITRGFYFEKHGNQTNYIHYSGHDDLDVETLNHNMLTILKNYIIYFRQQYYSEWVRYYFELFYDFVEFFKEKEIDIFIWDGDTYDRFEIIIDYTKGHIEDHHLSWNGHAGMAKEFIKQIESGVYYNKNNPLLYKCISKKKSLIG